MKKEIKNNINLPLDYYHGFGSGRYRELLDELCIHGNVNSCETSTIPLAEFWQPDNLGKICELLRPYIPDFDCARALKYFEFPTEAVAGGKTIGRPSMTDLMILDGCCQIAIEAKYTEYSKMPNETVSEWLIKAQLPRSVRRQVAECWLRYIREAGCTELNANEGIEQISNVCYQFLHRTASACHKADVVKGPYPVLVYQLFFDAGNPDSINDCITFKAELKKWAAMLNLVNMKFLIMSVPVVNAEEVRKRYGSDGVNIFNQMKHWSIYKFDFDGIEIEDVIGEAE